MTDHDPLALAALLDNRQMPDSALLSVSLGELRAAFRPKLTAERLAWLLTLHTDQPTIEWWDPETMNLTEMTWADWAAAILAALDDAP